MRTSAWILRGAQNDDGGESYVLIGYTLILNALEGIFVGVDPLWSRNHSVETAKDAKKRENHESDLILGDALPYSFFRDPEKNQNFPGSPSRTFAPFAVQLHRSGWREVARSAGVCQGAAFAASGAP